VCGDNPELHRAAFAQFQEVNQADARLLSGAVDARDLPQVKRLAHRIKGASRTLGAEALAFTCQSIEAAARDEDWEAIAVALEALQAEVARLGDYIASHSADLQRP
jgi:HPt (histidine-containing phosphotransfer) domain-containing protein